MEKANQKKQDSNLIKKQQLKRVMGTVNISKEYLETLEKKIGVLIQESKNRALSNGRKTVLARDL